MSILVTGGAGYIGSHTVVELLEEGEEVIIVDNFINSTPDILEKIKQISKRSFKFYELDVADESRLKTVFEENNITSVIHFAGLKAVGESVEKPIEYYYNNLTSTLVLLKTMRKYGCKSIVFSSSATVYGNQNNPKYTENMGRGKTANPYGTTKAMIEQILEDLFIADNTWKIVILRYFNPIGAHQSGLIGDNPNGLPNNLMPYIQKVAIGELKQLNIFGNDYNTTDGTGIRDYIHVVDLAKGHIKALQNTNEHGIYIYNLGTGRGYSVLEIVETFESVNNVKIPYVIAPRRKGDLDAYYANPALAENEIKWYAEKNLSDMCRDSWNYIKKQNEK